MPYVPFPSTSRTARRPRRDQAVRFASICRALVRLARQVPFAYLNDDELRLIEPALEAASSETALALLMVRSAAKERDLGTDARPTTRPDNEKAALLRGTGREAPPRRS